jgi:hypothetical protein
MHIYWIILAEILLALIDFLTMKFMKTHGFVIYGFRYGFKPILYQKIVDGIQFRLGLVPFFGGILSYQSDLDKNKPKFLSEDLFSFLCEIFAPFVIVLLTMITINLVFCGMDITLIILKLIFTFHLNVIEWALLFNKLDSLKEIFRLPVSITIYATLIYWYAAVIRNILNLILQKIFKNITELAQYVFTTYILFLIISQIPTVFFGHLLNFSTTTPFLLFDWIIGHLIFVIIIGLIIEIYSRKYALEK